MVMAHTPHDEREATLRGLLKFQFGVADAESVANPLAAAATAAGYADEYDMALSVLCARPGKSAVVNARRRRVKSERPVAETAEEAKIPDDELLLVLESLDDQLTGVRGPDWYRELTSAFEKLGGKMSMTKDGFYARVKKLVESGKVKAVEVKVPQKLYGRDVLATVTLYSLPAEVPVAAKEGGVA